MTALSGIGDALQSGIAARNAAQTGALNQALVKAKTLESVKPLMDIYQHYQEAGVEPPPFLTNALKIAGGMGGNTAPLGGTAASVTAATGGGAGGGAAIPDIRKAAAATLGLPPMAVVSANPSIVKAIDEQVHAMNPTIADAEEKKAITASDVASYGKEYQAVQGASRIGHQINSLADQADALLNLMQKSGYKSGGLVPPELQKAWAKFTGNPNAVFSADAFQKITSESLTKLLAENQADLAQMGTTGGRNLLSTVQLFLKSSPNLDLTDPTNRYLVDQLRRSANQAVEIGDKAAEFKRDHGRLNAQWDIDISKYHKNNPQYSPETLAGLGAGTQIPGSPPAPVAAPPAPAPVGASKEVYKNGVLIGHVVGNAFVPVQTQQATVPGPAPIPGPGQ
jgi:hypothetical protein